jgi:hypothetical protein
MSNLESLCSSGELVENGPQPPAGHNEKSVVTTKKLPGLPRTSREPHGVGWTNVQFSEPFAANEVPATVK